MVEKDSQEVYVKPLAVHETAMIPATLKNLLDSAVYISFDIFDTAVIRSVLKPVDVFLLVAGKFTALGGILPTDFQRVRIESERMAREKAWNQRQAAETTLVEIYQSMQDDFRIAPQVTRQLKELEVDIEMKVCMKNEYIYALYRYCLEQGKKVIFASDMYLPLDVVLTILNNAGYIGYHKVFLSSSIGKTKATGEMYELMLKELSVQPEEMLHIGDNPDSDITMPAQYGIKTYFYKKCRDRALQDNEFREHWFKEDTGGENSIEKSLCAATLVNRLYADDPLEQESEQEFWYELGYKYVGLLFFGFGKWLLDLLIKDRIEKVYFLSRDGFIMKKVYDTLSKSFGHTPPSEYMYASRRALNLPAITELNDEDLNFLVSGTSTLTVSQFLERVGFDPSHYDRKIRDAGFSGRDDKVISGREYGMLRQLYLSIADDIRGKALRERELLFAYFRDVGLFGTERVGIVDIGWHGSMQYSISRILRLMGKEVYIKGYYLGTWSKAREFHDAGYAMNAYLCEFGQPRIYEDIIKCCVEIFEFIHTAPHGSVINFERINGNIGPVFDKNDQESERMHKAQIVQRGAMDLVEDLSEAWKHFPFLKVSKDIIIKPLHRVLSEPSYRETVYLGDLEHAEGFGDVYVKRAIAKPPGLLETIMNPRSYFNGYRQAFWKKGYKKRFSPLNRLYKK
jgi:HAD superfamily hydrolase (TIGR01549 family)